MSTIKQVAEAFASGKKAKCHNAETDGFSYWLHGNRIAYKTKDGVKANWLGYFTVTTTNHLNKIATALGSNIRVSYAKARDNNTAEFQL